MNLENNIYFANKFVSHLALPAKNGRCGYVSNSKTGRCDHPLLDVRFPGIKACFQSGKFSHPLLRRSTKSCKKHLSRDEVIGISDRASQRAENRLWSMSVNVPSDSLVPKPLTVQQTISTADSREAGFAITFDSTDA